MKNLNLQGVKCPETFLFTKLAIEKLSVGQKLLVLFSGMDSANSVSKSISIEGHRVISLKQEPSPNNLDSSTQVTLWKLLIEKC